MLFFIVDFLSSGPLSMQVLIFSGPVRAIKYKTTQIQLAVDIAWIQPGYSLDTTPNINMHTL